MYRTHAALCFCAFLLACPRSYGQPSKTAPSADKAEGPGTRRKVHVRLLRDNAPTAARVTIEGSDGGSYGPAGAALRKAKRGESYFYADGAFDVEPPSGRVRMTVSGGLETIPQVVTVDAAADTELSVRMPRWIDMAARGWYSGDSHVHLHTGGPINVRVSDA